MTQKERNKKPWYLFLMAMGLFIITMSYTVVYPILNIVTGLVIIGFAWYKMRK